MLAYLEKLYYLGCEEYNTLNSSLPNNSNSIRKPSLQIRPNIIDDNLLIKPIHILSQTIQ